MYDIIIIGGGPAGLTAALYARRANKTVLVIEKASFGGQITYSPKVENIPGFGEVTGNEFAEKLVEQVLNQDAEVECAEVLSIKDGDIKTVVTDSGEFKGKSVIIATGAKHRLLGLENETNLIGEGISFCAVCDGAFYEGKTVAVIGGGNSALQEALLLSIPNMPHDAAPVGEDESANPELRVWGTKPEIAEPKDHVELGTSLGLLNFEDSARISGSGFIVYRGKGARLERALINFMIDCHPSIGFKEWWPPVIPNATIINSSRTVSQKSLPRQNGNRQR